MTETATTPKYMAVQGAAMLMGAVLLLLGLAGFIPGLTSGYDGLTWWGHGSTAQLFGTFTVSALHNAVHLAIGAAGFLLARSYAAARAYLLGSGVFFLGLWGYGLAIDKAGPANIIPVDNAGNWLHFTLGVVMVTLGLTLAARRDPTKHRSRRAHA
ncbi:DUF4383 domain-containing protein [Mycolicibacterium thermoresistibile]